jgi:phosphoglycerol transferase MdoB-like AlkP superfamily enzyme
VNQILLFLHFVGLMLGATGGFGSALVMRRAQGMAPDAAQTLRQLGPTLANLSAAGVALLWITGLVMVWSQWDGPGSLPGLFWLKFVFVLTLTAAVALIHMTYADIRRGNAAAAARLPKLGPVAGVSALLAVLFACFAFS